MPKDYRGGKDNLVEGEEFESSAVGHEWFGVSALGHFWVSRS